MRFREIKRSRKFAEKKIDESNIVRVKFLTSYKFDDLVGDYVVYWILIQIGNNVAKIANFNNRDKIKLYEHEIDNDIIKIVKVEDQSIKGCNILQRQIKPRHSVGARIYEYLKVYRIWTSREPVNYMLSFRTVKWEVEREGELIIYLAREAEIQDDNRQDG